MPDAMLNRRRLLAAAAGLTAAAATRATGEPSLAAIAARRGLRFGAAVRLEQVAGDEMFSDAVVRECSLLTPELALKWGALEAEPGRFDFAPMDSLARFAARHRKRLRGHALLWHRSVPDWASARIASGDWEPVRRYFARTVPRYRAAAQWDVVNEPIETGRRTDGLRENAFLAGFGADYIRRALDEARALAPKAVLMLNEFGLEYDLPVERDRRTLLLKLVERLKTAGAPLDGIGLQGHLDLGKGRLPEGELRDFLGELAGFGLEIAITELDVKESAYTAPAEMRDRLVAEAAKAYLDVALDEPAVRSITCWGLSDRYSWLGVTPDDFARFSGAWASGDGPGLNRGLPFDAAMKPKPLYRAIRAALETRPLASGGVAN